MSPPSKIRKRNVRLLYFFQSLDQRWSLQQSLIPCVTAGIGRRQIRHALQGGVKGIDNSDIGSRELIARQKSVGSQLLLGELINLVQPRSKVCILDFGKDGLEN